VFSSSIAILHLNSLSREIDIGVTKTVQMFVSDRKVFGKIACCDSLRFVCVKSNGK